MATEASILSSNVSKLLNWIKAPVVVDKYHLLALGILAVISGPFYSWNVGLKAGFGSFAIITGLMGWAYSCFCFCASELSSALPFAGGSYGLARCTLGYYLGFLTGCCEIMYYILLTAFINVGIADFIIDVNSKCGPYFDAIIVLIFFSQIVAISTDGRIFWRLVLLLTWYSVIIIIIYCFGSLGSVDFNKYAFTLEYYTNTTEFIGPPPVDDNVRVARGLFWGGVSQSLESLPYSLYFYIGAELLNLTCNDVKNPREEIPFGQIGTMWAMLVQSILVLFICCSLAPGTDEVQTKLAPLSDGYRRIFGLRTETATMLALIPAYGSGLMCMLGCGKLISAMAESRIFPKILARRLTANQSPVYALCVGGIVGFAVILVLNRFFIDSLAVFYNVTLLLAFIIYVVQCVGYVVLRQKMEKIERKYYSPVGIAGAVYAIVMFAIGIIACFFFQNDHYTTLYLFLAFVLVCSLYYGCYIRYRQTFSQEERDVMFVAHVQASVGAGARQGKRIVPLDSQYSNYYSFARFGLRFQNQATDRDDVSQQVQTNRRSVKPKPKISFLQQGDTPSRETNRVEAQYIPSSVVSNNVGSEYARPSLIPLSLFSTVSGQFNLSSNNSNNSGKADEAPENTEGGSNKVDRERDRSNNQQSSCYFDADFEQSNDATTNNNTNNNAGSSWRAATASVGRSSSAKFGNSSYHSTSSAKGGSDRERALERNNSSSASYNALQASASNSNNNNRTNAGVSTLYAMPSTTENDLESTNTSNLQRLSSGTTLKVHFKKSNDSNDDNGAGGGGGSIS